MSFLRGLKTKFGGKPAPTSGDPSQAMRAMRLQLLTAPAEAVGIAPTAEFPHVFGVLMEHAMGPHIVTVSGMIDGNASLYTTSSFGVIGAGQHAGPRRAAIELVRVAQSAYEAASPAEDHSYPSPDAVQFLLIGFSGVRRLADHLEEVGKGQGACTERWVAGQQLLTEIRLASEGRT